MRTLLLTTAVLLALSSTAHATKPSRDVMPNSNCKLIENITVGINFNNIGASSIANAKAEFDKKAAQIADVAGELKIADMQPQSMNYNIYAQHGNNTDKYKVNGSYNYKMDSSDLAFKFATMLEQKGMSANINSSSYRQGNCN